MNEEIKKETDVTAAIDLLGKGKEKTKLGGSGSTEKKESVPGVKTYAGHEIAVTVNAFITENLDQQCGKYLVGENLARTLEHHGLKSKPVVGLGIAVVMVVIHIIGKFFKAQKEKEKEEQDGIQRTG
jgi:hypothetical protein